MMPGKRINTSMIAYSLLMRKKKINWYTNSLRVRKSEKFVCSFVPNDLAELRRGKCQSNGSSTDSIVS